MKIQVAPNLRPPVPPFDEVSGCPYSLTFQPCRWWSFELPRLSHPSVLLVHDSPGCPAASLFQ